MIIMTIEHKITSSKGANMLKSIIYICLSTMAFSTSACIPSSHSAYISSEPLHHSDIVYTTPPVHREIIPSFPSGYHRYDPAYLTPGEYSNYYWKHHNGYWYRHLRVKSSYEVYTTPYHTRYHHNRHRRHRLAPRARVRIKRKGVHPAHKKHKGKKKWRKH